jgi:hypothetical protein
VTGNFRHMLKGDDPNFVRSRQNSLDDGEPSRRISQDSRSTRYRSGGPGSVRDGPSRSSTRPNSMRALDMSAPASRAGSQANSRRNSPKRSPSIPLDEAKERLKKMAEQQQASRSRASLEENRRGRSRAASPVSNRPQG